jgi:DNA-binding transcriptional ArsR family regulator
MADPGRCRRDEPSAASLRATALHPTRLQILVELARAASLSAAQISARTGVPVRSVRHQISRLASEGLVEVTSSRGRRGAIEKFYELRVSPTLDSADYQVMRSDDARRMTLEVFRYIMTDATRAVAGGGFEPDGGYEVRFGLELDDEGWAEGARITGRAFEEITLERERAAARLKDRPEEDRRNAVSVLIWFEKPRADRPSSGRPLRVAPTGSASPGTLAEAMGHPIRAQMLFVLAENPPLGVAQIAERVRRPASTVRHHLDRLLRDGLVEKLPGAARRRTYVPCVNPLLDDEALKRLSSTQARDVRTEILRRLVIDVSASIATGTIYRRPDFVETHIPLAVDAEGWANLGAITKRAIGEIEAVQREASMRLARRNEAPISATVVALWFELPER